MTARYILFAAAAAILTGCKSKQPLESREAVIDTTKVSSDSVGGRTVSSETSSKSETWADSSILVFEPGGGTLTVDTAGGIALHGLQSWKVTRRRAKSNTKAKRQAEDSATVSYDRYSGLAFESVRHPVQDKRTTQAWYENAFMHIGALCCIAALIYVMFLYLKRKL